MKNLPEIRFNGSSASWREMPFLEIANRVSTTSFSGEIPGVEYEDIISGEGSLNKDLHDKDCKKTGKLFCEGDVLFGKLRPYLKNIILADFKGVAIGDFWVLRSNDVDSSFLYMLINSDSFMKVANVSSGSKMPRADWNLVSSTLFSIPSNKTEQEFIGHYFTNLDSLIKTATAKLASLKQVKAASLQAMFPQGGATVPKLRFKGFDGEWEKVKLEDCLEISQQRNVDDKYGKEDVLSVSDEEGVVNQIELLGRSFAGQSVSNYKILKPNQIVYTKSPLRSKPYGIVKMNKGKVGIVSVLYAVYETKDGICPDYIHYYFDPSERINHYLLPLVNKGAKNTMNISDEMALQGYISLPSYSEQQKIANYLTTIDKQIFLQSQRLEKLKQIKAACLDKMFV